MGLNEGQNINSQIRYNWSDKHEFVVNLIKNNPGLSYKQYSKIINSNFPNEPVKMTPGKFGDYLSSQVYFKHPELKNIREKKVKIRRKRYNFKGKEKKLLKIFKGNIRKKWKDIVEIVNKEFPEEPVKVTARNLIDYFHIHVSKELIELRKKETHKRDSYLWTEKKILFLEKLLKDNPKLSYAEIINIINKKFKKGKRLTRGSLGVMLTTKIYRKPLKNGRKMNKKGLKRIIEWRGEIQEFLKGLLEVDEHKENQKVNNISEILEKLKEEFPEQEHKFTYLKVYDVIKRKFPEHVNRLSVQFNLTDDFVEYLFKLIKEDPDISAPKALKKIKKDFNTPYSRKPPSLCAMQIYLRNIRKSLCVPEDIESKRDILEKIQRTKRAKRERQKAVI
ncbi:hypothetical protein KO317_02985 [Candidatus Micrarchaeota archaeon]|nr:hypothetical protein [Candidatus Micrarchaeota archaeon]